MSLAAILLPVLVQVALTLVLAYWMGLLRTRAIRRGDVDVDRIALREPGWPKRTQQVSNAYASQFELPVLFYVLVILAIIARKADLLFVALSWLFVATRIVHAVIHTGRNVVARRGLAFGVGVTILAAMWIMFAIKLLTGL